ncbi:MAG: tRNA (N(6)-L-threonylcarbamoyladenosine(37)-C(2))-methylthiotransferase MtaB, partial [Draconibacterium sp.]
NTCSVTNQSDKTGRNIIRQAIRRNPDAMIIVVGCYAQLKPQEIGNIDGVDLILGNNEKFHIPMYLGNLEKRETTEIKVDKIRKVKSYHRALSWGDRTRSFLKVQDGCDYFCSFCTIPLARGRSRNDTIETTVKEAQASIAKGYKELVLTGVNIGDFGKSTGESFFELLKSLAEIEGLKRLRIGSIEPNLLTNEIIELVADSEVVMPHFHIPLQAGTDEVLTLMRRKYDTALFQQRIEKIRETMPHAFIGVDIIAGTNGETEDLFRKSYDFIKKLDISQLHPFTYSERNDTKAMQIPGKVPVEERKIRTQQYVNLSEKKLHAFYEKHVGTIQNVLFENQQDKDRMYGFSENYIKVETTYNASLVNTIIPVRLLSILESGNVQPELLT